MIEVNYESEVKKKYPDAEIDWMKQMPFKRDANGELELEFWVMHYVDEKHTTLGDVKFTEQDAWKSAFERIKNKN